MTAPGRDENSRQAAYDEFRRSRGKYPRAAAFLDADRRGEIEQDANERREQVSKPEQGTHQPEPARL